MWSWENEVQLLPLPPSASQSRSSGHEAVLCPWKTQRKQTAFAFGWRLIRSFHGKDCQKSPSLLWKGWQESRIQIEPLQIMSRHIFISDSRPWLLNQNHLWGTYNSIHMLRLPSRALTLSLWGWYSWPWPNSPTGDSNVQPRLRIIVWDVPVPDKPSSRKKRNSKGLSDKGIPNVGPAKISNKISRGLVSQFKWKHSTF